MLRNVVIQSIRISKPIKTKKVKMAIVTTSVRTGIITKKNNDPPRTRRKEHDAQRSRNIITTTILRIQEAMGPIIERNRKALLGIPKMTTPLLGVIKTMSLVGEISKKITTIKPMIPRKAIKMDVARRVHPSLQIDQPKAAMDPIVHRTEIMISPLRVIGVFKKQMLQPASLSFLHGKALILSR